MAAADREETVELRIRVPIHDAGRLHAVASKMFGVTDPMLARILIHFGLEHFDGLGAAGKAAIDEYDAEHPR